MKLFHSLCLPTAIGVLVLIAPTANATEVSQDGGLRLLRGAGKGEDGLGADTADLADTTGDRERATMAKVSTAVTAPSATEAPMPDESSASFLLQVGNTPTVPTVCDYNQASSYDCWVELNFCTQHDFSLADHCEYHLYDYALPSEPTRVCATTDPTVVVLPHMDLCASRIGSVEFDLSLNGAPYVHHVDTARPYTLLDAAISPEHSLNSLILPKGSYAMQLVINDLIGCPLKSLNFNFDVVECTDDYY